MKVEITLKHGGKKYTFIPDQCEYDGMSQAEFMWTDGNFGCDCNKSLFIQRQCDNDFPEMECGDEVKLVCIVSTESARAV